MQPFILFNSVAVAAQTTSSLILGEVKVLFVNVCVAAKPAKLSDCKAVLNSPNEPVKVLVSKSIDLFVNVSVVALPTNVSAAAGKIRSTFAVEAAPTNVTAFVPLSVPSKNLTLPPTVVLVAVIVGAVIVFFVKVCVPVSVVTLESIAIVPVDVIAPPDKPVPAVTEVTVPVLEGVITVKVIESEPNDAVLFVVHKNILLSLALP